MIRENNEIEKLKEYISAYFSLLERKISEKDSEILKLLEKLEKERDNEYITQCMDTKDIKVISYLDN